MNLLAGIGETVKLRIFGTELRLRVTNEEIESLAMGEVLSETIRFSADAAAQFTYRLEQDPGASEHPLLLWEPANTVRILLPREQILMWSNSKRKGTGIYHRHDVSGSEPIWLSIERDLDRSHRRGRDTESQLRAH